MSRPGPVKGRVRKNRRTKRLVLQLKPGEIALIDHANLDGPAAEALVECRPAAVLNAQPSMTGDYPNRGPEVLATAGVPLLDLGDPALFAELLDGQLVTLQGEEVVAEGRVLARGMLLDAERVQEQTQAARAKTRQLLTDFAVNTLEFVRGEPDVVLPAGPLPEIATKIRGRHVVIVARGAGAREDLRAIRAYVEDIRPVLIGVDGGADILAAEGLHPDLIIGDLDSASDEVLQGGSEVVVHAYADGRAPGLARSRALGLESPVLAAPGTSEDAALALAHEKGADLIVAVGSHTNLPDFLEKGRHGMASTFLTRLKVGDRLVDAKGVSKLYRPEVSVRHLAFVAAAAVLTAAAVLMVSPFARGVLAVAGMRVVLFLRHLWRAIFG